MANLSEIILAELPEGKEAVIVDINAGRNLKRRLYELGILPGTKIKKISGRGRGPSIIEYKNSRFALGYGMSRKIEVQYEP